MDPRTPGPGSIHSAAAADQVLQGGQLRVRQAVLVQQEVYPVHAVGSVSLYYICTSLPAVWSALTGPAVGSFFRWAVASSSGKLNYNT